VARTEPAPNASVSTSAVASPSFFIVFNASPSEGLLKRFRLGPAEGRGPAVPLQSHANTRQRTCQRARTPRTPTSRVFRDLDTRARARVAVAFWSRRHKRHSGLRQK
jgi:hypothetical protein